MKHSLCLVTQKRDRLMTKELILKTSNAEAAAAAAVEWVVWTLTTSLKCSWAAAWVAVVVNNKTHSEIWVALTSVTCKGVAAVATSNTHLDSNELQKKC